VPVTLTCGDLETTWLPEHGMVGASLRHRGEELLGQRGGLDAYLQRGSAFGIPLLAPWANRLGGLAYGDVELDPATVKTDAAGLPKDGGGVLVGRSWTIEDATRSELVARFEADVPVLAVFPFPHTWRVRVSLGPASLGVETELHAAGDVAVPVAFGWHPLFTLPGVEREELELTLPTRGQLALDARGIPNGARFDDPAPAPSAVLGERGIDAEFDAWDGDMVLRGGGRELRVEFGPPGYPIGHAWAPQGESFVAWEPMTAPTNALVSGDRLRHVAPGETFFARFAVHVTAV